MINLLANTSSAQISELLDVYLDLYIAILVVVLIIQIAIIVGCVNIAKNKGYSGFGWGLAAWFFGLIALIILLCLPSQNTSPYIAKSSNSWTCPKCGQLHFFAGSKCTACGNDRYSSSTQKSKSASPQTQKSNPIQPPKNTKTWTCPKCGEKNNINAKNCINCFAEKP